MIYNRRRKLACHIKPPMASSVNANRKFLIGMFMFVIVVVLVLLSFHGIVFCTFTFPTGLTQYQKRVDFRSLTTIDEVTSAHSPITHTDHHQYHAIEYFATLKTKLTDLSRKIYENHRGNALEHSVCVGLNIRTYGGLGNQLGTIKGAQALAFSTNRHFILNSPVILSMFDHPDPEQNWHQPAMDSPSWNGRQKSFSQCSESLSFAHQHGGLLGINRCDQNVCHNPESDMMQWLFSRPTPKWNDFIRQKSCELFPGCLAKHTTDDHCRADFAIQVRTFADMHVNSHHQHGEDKFLLDERFQCYLKCAKARILQLEEELHRPICVFVTSDNTDLSEEISNNLNKIPNTQAVFNVIPGNVTFSHSADMLFQQRFNYKFDVEALQSHPEFVDWMLFSEAASAMHTAQSTFSRSARERAGIVKSLHDILLSDSKDSCTCEAMFPNHRHH